MHDVFLITFLLIPAILCNRKSFVFFLFLASQFVVFAQETKEKESEIENDIPIQEPWFLVNVWYVIILVAIWLGYNLWLKRKEIFKKKEDVDVEHEK